MLDCSKCGKSLPNSEFHKDSSQTRGYQCYCKSCKKAYQRPYMYRYHRTYVSRMQDKIRNQTPARAAQNNARVVVHTAVARGDILVPLFCEYNGCGESLYLQAHHHKGYAEKNRLEVCYLCPPHHRQVEAIPSLMENVSITNEK